MSNTDPVFIDHPGAGRLRSQTLDEYMAALQPDHPARAELAQIRALALDGMKSAHDLLAALQKVDELQKELIAARADKISALQKEQAGLKAELSADRAMAADLAVAAGITTAPAPQFACPECGKPMGSLAGLKRHIYFKHPKPAAQ